MTDIQKLAIKIILRRYASELKQLHAKCLHSRAIEEMSLKLEEEKIKHIEEALGISDNVL